MSNSLPSLRGFAGTELRARNRSLTLNMLRLHGRLSRAELARLIGLTPPAIANIINDLMDEKLVHEVGRRKTSRGQPPIVVEINNSGACAIGIRIDSSSYDLTICDLGGAVLATDQGVVEGTSETELLDFIALLYRQHITRYGQGRCLGLGIVTPGPFDAVWPGFPTPGCLPALQTFAIVEKLSAKIGNVVFLENDATAAALCEKLYGEAKDLENFFFVFIGEGVGGGIVIAGMPYAGQSRNAGEFGHIIVDPNGPQCYCGNRGCLGQYLSLQSQRSFVADGMPESERLQLWLERAAEALSSALVNIENLLDPEVIILGGLAPQDLLKALAQRLGKLRPSIRMDLGKPRLTVSQLGGQSAALGASSLPVLSLLTPR